MTEPNLQLIDRNAKAYTKTKDALRDGLIPGVLYSKGQPTQAFFADEGDLSRMISTYGTNRKISVTLNNQKTYAIIKEFQKQRLKNQFVHFDLQALNENEKIRVSSAIHITNRDAAEQEGKILQVQTHEVEIQMFPRHMPESVVADAALLLEKDSITVGDLNIANDNNIEILTDLETVVATLVYAQVATEAVDEDAEAPSDATPEAEPTDSPAEEAAENQG